MLDRERALAMQNTYKRHQCNISQKILLKSVEMLRLNVVQMAHAELTSTIYRSTLQPNQEGAATWSKVTSGKTQWQRMKGVYPWHTQSNNVWKWTQNTCKGTPERIERVHYKPCTADRGLQGFPYDLYNLYDYTASHSAVKE